MRTFLPLIVTFTVLPVAVPQTSTPVGGAGMATIQQSSNPDTPHGRRHRAAAEGVGKPLHRERVVC